MVELTVNGETRTIAEPMLLAEFLESFGLNARMVVVEYNREIVPRDRYAEIRLQTGDALEIVQMMAGG